MPELEDMTGSYQLVKRLQLVLWHVPHEALYNLSSFTPPRREISAATMGFSYSHAAAGATRTLLAFESR